MLVEIKEKAVYGTIMLYPNNDTAHKFAKLIKKKTFYYEDINLINSLGHEIKIIKMYQN
jgi:hypothetical protein